MLKDTPNILKIKRLYSTATLPKYQSDGASGMDLHADLVRSFGADRYILGAGRRILVKCGFAIGLETGFEGQIRSRSGLALKYGVHVLNSPGTIDADFAGEIGAILINTSTEPFEINHNDRIAQLVIAPVTRVVLEEVSELPQTVRGVGGFGSTGTK